MGKDKRTLNRSSKEGKAFLKELEERRMKDCVTVLEQVDMQFDMLLWCWSCGYNYAMEEAIKKLEKLNRKMK